MKTYKHPILGREAFLYNQYINDGDCYYCREIDEWSYSRYYTEKELKALWFEEIPEEPVQEIPDWFEKFLAGIWEVWDRYKPKKTLFVEYKYFDVGLLYKLFLKHYPQTEYLK